ncbi:MAG: VIT family protein [Synechococcaceae cyanobacterium]|nr:VIT family protein [Synechococcaceae cyanobacterium]
MPRPSDRDRSPSLPRRRSPRHLEAHRSHRVGWLRAMVLGANDGTISIASLVVGIAASGAPRQEILLSGVAATVAGALSMAAGEYVSVQSQADTEQADLARERRELASDPAGELLELTEIYVRRGLDPSLARRVAEQLTLRDPLAAHARDELGLTEELRARPIQAAITSACSFSIGSAVPILSILASPANRIASVTTVTSLGVLIALGGLAAQAGGAPVLPGAWRMLLWGALAMGLTALVGWMFGTVV